MERKKSKNKVYITKKTIKIWDVNFDNIVVSNLTEIKTNSKYFIEIKFDKAIRPLVLIMPKMSGYVKTLKVEDKINNLISFYIGDEKLLENIKLFGLGLKT